MLAISGIAGASGAGLQPAALTDDQLALITDDALRFASASGEPAPRIITMVGGKRKLIVAATTEGVEVDTDDEVVAIQLEGDFIGYQAPTPRGLPLPRGRYLLLVYDAATRELIDWSLSERPDELSQFKPLGSP